MLMDEGQSLFLDAEKETFGIVCN